MIKLVYCIRKRSDIDSQSFYRYWREEHGPLVRSVAEAIGACRYVQSHTVLPELNARMLESRKLQVPYDGITEVWWESEAALEQGMSSSAGIDAQRKLIEDESRFIDQPVASVYDGRARYFLKNLSLDLSCLPSMNLVLAPRKVRNAQ